MSNKLLHSVQKYYENDYFNKMGDCSIRKFPHNATYTVYKIV